MGDDWIRLDNSRRLYKTITEAAAKYDAAILGGGDLNCPNTSWAMKYLVEQGLRDAQDTATISPRGVPTNHNDPVRDSKGIYYGTFPVRGTALKWNAIDHVFYDPKRVKVNRFMIDVSAEASSLSDHNPIVADYDLL